MTPGAPEAPMTPEQRAKDVFRTLVRLIPGIFTYKGRWIELQALIAAAIREAESSALRRAADVAKAKGDKLVDLADTRRAAGVPTRDIGLRATEVFGIESAIRALIPSSPPAESDNG